MAKKATEPNVLYLEDSDDDEKVRLVSRLGGPAGAGPVAGTSTGPGTASYAASAPLAGTQAPAGPSPESTAGGATSAASITSFVFNEKDAAVIRVLESYGTQKHRKSVGYVVDRDKWQGYEGLYRGKSAKDHLPEFANFLGQVFKNHCYLGEIKNYGPVVPFTELLLAFDVESRIRLSGSQSAAWDAFSCLVYGDSHKFPNTISEYLALMPNLTDERFNLKGFSKKAVETAYGSWVKSTPKREAELKSLFRGVVGSLASSLIKVRDRELVRSGKSSEHASRIKNPSGSYAYNEAEEQFMRDLVTC
ncbi:hypothetical protein JCM3774_001774 [Rhodotorula dairenensis]